MKLNSTVAGIDAFRLNLFFELISTMSHAKDFTTLSSSLETHLRLLIDFDESYFIIGDPKFPLLHKMYISTLQRPRLTLTNISDDKWHLCYPEITSKTYGNKLCFPLETNKEIFGAMILIRSTDFNFSEIRFAESISKYLSQMLDNFSIHEKLIETNELLLQKELSSRQTEEQLNHALNSGQMVAMHIDLKTKIISMTGGMEELYGENINESISDYIKNRIHPEDRNEAEISLIHALKYSSEYLSQYRITRPDGKERWILARGNATLDMKGQPIYFSAINADITFRKVAEEKLVSANLKLEEQNQLRERFVSALTHDLRTPMAAASIAAQIMQKNSANSEMVNAKSLSILASVNRADKMISDLLDSNHINAGGGIPLFIEECRLDLLILKIVTELNDTHTDRFQIKNDTGEITGHWDLSAIRRIVENVATNAIKYGSPNAPVIITLSSTSQWISIDIKNEGAVISLKDQNILFGQYSRTKSAIVSGQRGWGIGLTLVKGLAEAHHGNIRLESTIENGTIFTISLPRDASEFRT